MFALENDMITRTKYPKCKNWYLTGVNTFSETNTVVNGHPGLQTGRGGKNNSEERGWRKWEDKNGLYKR